MSLVDKIQAGTLDPNIPAWKRDLIMKKRSGALRSCNSSTAGDSRLRAVNATSEAYSTAAGGNNSHGNVSHPEKGCASGPSHKDTAQHFRHIRHSVAGKSSPDSVLDAAAAAAQVAGSKTRSASLGGDACVENKWLNRVSRRMGEEKLLEVSKQDVDGHATSSPSPSYSSYSDGFAYQVGYDYENSQEYEYGPGFVDRLKSKFINLTVQERGKSSSNIALHPGLRRVASLEHILDVDSERNGIGHGTGRYAKFTASGSRHGGVSSKLRRPEALKKARSMETLTAIDGTFPSVGRWRPSSSAFSDETNTVANLLINENVIIIEQSTNVNNKLSNDHGSPVMVRREKLSRRHGSISIDEDELPKPDTVRTFKKIFEGGLRTNNEQSNQKAQAPLTQPVVLRNKIGVGNRSKGNNNNVSSTGGKADTSSSNSQPKMHNNNSNLNVSAKVSWVVEATACGLVKNNDIGEINNYPSKEPDSPKSNHNKLQTENMDGSGMINTNKPMVNGDVKHSDLNAVIRNEKRQEDNGDALDGVKLITSDSLNRLRDQSSVSVYFGPKSKMNNAKHDAVVISDNIKETKEATDGTLIGENESSKLPVTNKPRVVDIKTKLEDSMPVGLIKPIIVNATAPAEERENLINKAKSALAKTSAVNGNVPPTSVVNGTPTAKDDESSPDKVTKASALKKTMPGAEPSVMVFNFKDREDIKPQISNYRSPFPLQRPVMNILDATTSESHDDGDEDWMDGMSNEPILPCGIVFEGENVVIGRTCLMQKRNKELKIGFNDGATETYEYPSETVMLDEYISVHGPGPDDAASDTQPSIATSNTQADEDSAMVTSSGSTLKTTPALSSIGGLASYVPSKLSGHGDEFELGVSRPVPAELPTLPEQTGSEAAEMMLKPIEDQEADSWSTSQAAETDLLF